MLGHLARVLEQVAADADVRLSRLALLARGGARAGARGVEPDGGRVPGGPRASTSCSRRRRRARPTPWRWSGGRRARSATRSWTRGPTSWRTTCARWAWAPRRAWACCLERSADMVVRCWRSEGGRRLRAAGPALPAERLASCWRTAASACCSPTPGTSAPARGGRRHVVALDRRRRRARPPARSTAPRRGATAGQPAPTSIYTSGSTGRPKGVMVGAPGHGQPASSPRRRPDRPRRDRVRAERLARASTSRSSSLARAR